LAAGNPVVVKAHPAHPGTSELVGTVVREAVRGSGLPAGVFSLLFDAGIEVGIALVRHSAIKAVAFTGSASGGQALMRLAAERPEPIPSYAEMGSTNPLFILPGAIRERSAQLAQGLQASFTLGSGQFCTKPGLVFVPDGESEVFIQGLQGGVGQTVPFGMLTRGIAAKYNEAIQQRVAAGQAKLIAGASEAAEIDCARGAAAVFGISLADFAAHPELGEEIFGPTTLLVHYGSQSDLLGAAKKLQGHLTATIHGTEEDLANAHELIRVLETKVGRILFNWRRGQSRDGSRRPLPGNFRRSLNLRRHAGHPAFCTTHLLSGLPRRGPPVRTSAGESSRYHAPGERHSYSEVTPLSLTLRDRVL
jgi:NADP-dependent aldehyde dehydrogenase